MSAVVLALNHKNKGNGTTTELLLLERELKYDCEDCCSVAKTSLELMRSREGEGDSDTGGGRVRHFLNTGFNSVFRIRDPVPF